MIETYKLLSGKYDSQVALKLPLYLPEGIAINYCNCIINIWNSLPDSVVMADTVNHFKYRLDNGKIMILCMITGPPTLEADSEFR